MLSSNPGFSTMEVQNMESILNFDQDLDVEVFDSVVKTMFSAGPCQVQANRTLEAFKQHPEAWKRVDSILEKSAVAQSKHIALTILEDLIKSVWNALPIEQRIGIKNFIVNFMIKCSSNDEEMEKNRLFLNKLNVVLVQILKRDWPHNWPTFISEIVNSGRTSLSLCENNMAVLKLLSEEIFDYSEEQIVSAKIVCLKNKLKSEFSEIYQLCYEILEKATKPSLVVATLETLLRFLNWIPHEYIFETNLIEMLANRFVETSIFRIVLKCFIEISGLECSPEYSYKIVFLYKAVISGISRLLPVTANIAQKWNNASDSDQQFIQNIALFLTTILSTKLDYLEQEAARSPLFEEVIIIGHRYLLNISEVDDRELFKICLEYWAKFTSNLSNGLRSDILVGQTNMNVKNGLNSRYETYRKILSSLRNVIIGAMVKPEEVLIVEIDGVVVREVLKESDTIFLYKSMRDVLACLTNLDVYDMEHIMKKKLEKFMLPDSPFVRSDLNKLCWAIGSISGAMPEEAEKNFLVIVIKTLLILCEGKRGKDDKAVVASNIMYVVGQYPRFLKAHWKFLKTVINKLFEFMHEKHEGVQDMACDTFIKIARKCQKSFVQRQNQEPDIYLNQILDNIDSIVIDLSHSQLQTFYEGVGCMISAEPDLQKQKHYVDKLMYSSNKTWAFIMNQVRRSPATLNSNQEISQLIRILRINISACTSIKVGYYYQLKVLYIDLITLYTTICGIITREISEKGAVPSVLNSQVMRGQRTVNKEIIRLLDFFVEHTNADDEVLQTMVPALLQTIVSEYLSADPSVKELLVLNLLTTIINKFAHKVSNLIPAIMDAVFYCTLDMINKNFEDYPDTRVSFYLMLQAITSNCFDAVLMFPPERFALYFDSLTWSSKHTIRDVSDVGLSTISTLLNKFLYTEQQIALEFYRNYYSSLLQDIMFIITNPFHKAGFDLQCTILMHMISIACDSTVGNMIYPPEELQSRNTNAISMTKTIIEEFVRKLFHHLQDPQMECFVSGLFLKYKDAQAFHSHVNDFLIASKEVAGSEDIELFGRLNLPGNEQDDSKTRKYDEVNCLSVPGSIRPSEAADVEDMTS